MENKFRSLILNGKFFNPDSLKDLVKEKLNSQDTPDWEGEIYKFIDQWLFDTDKIEVNTSGSTGTPKPVLLSKQSMIKSAQRTCSFLDLTKKNKALLCLPADFIAGKMMIVRAFVGLLDLHYLKPSASPGSEISINYDFSAMTPMQVYNSVISTDGKQNIQMIRKLLIGGGQIDNTLISILSGCSNHIYHTYGMTETITHVAMKKISGLNPDSGFIALPGVVFSKDERDCLAISDEILGLKPVVTNDLVNLISDKRFKYSGRIDNVINSGGVKIIPEIVEEKLKDVISDSFMIAGRTDLALGEKVCIVFEGQVHYNTKELIKIYDRAGLNRVEMPRSVYWISSFPKTSNGKIIRKQVVKIIHQMHN